jgi:hypothetical protein
MSQFSYQNLTLSTITTVGYTLPGLTEVVSDNEIPELDALVGAGLAKYKDGIQVFFPVQYNPYNGGLYANNQLLALAESTPYVNRTATGTVFTGPCELAGYDCIAVTASPTITIYDNTSAAGTIVVPTTTLVLGRVEFAWKRALAIGCHVVLSGVQTVNILVG